MWGAACDVPDMDIPPALILEPGASIVRYEALFEKQVTLSADDVESEHLDQLIDPTLES
jgi:hypothetical protein